MPPSAGPPRNPRVFIAYRRDDSGGYARAVANDLREIWGNDNVFLDVEPDALPKGVDYFEFAREKVKTSDVVVALIGTGWARSPNLERLAEPEDAVRLELLAAHDNHIALLPVTVGGARMPSRGTLPSELAWLERTNAHDLSDTRWKYDIGELVRAIQALVPAPLAPPPRTIPEPPRSIGPGPWHRLPRWWPIAVTVMLVVVILIAKAALDGPSKGTTDVLAGQEQGDTVEQEHASNTSTQAEQEVAPEGGLISEIPPGEEYIVVSRVGPVTVRSIPDRRGGPLYTLSNGTRVRVLEELDDWKRVMPMDSTISGWVSTHNLSLRQAGG